MSKASGVTQALAEFCVTLRYENLPAQAIVDAKNGILDLLGVACAGVQEESTRMVLAAVASANSGAAATVLGERFLQTPANAALVNGHAAHALDYDDTQHASGTHLSASTVPAALAVGEMWHRSGRDLIVSYVAGFELGVRLGRVARFGNHLSRRGIHATNHLGHFAAVAAAGKLSTLDSDQMNCALGLAAGHASGLMKSFGTMAKGEDPANAAHNAVLAALLAARGFSGPRDIFEGEHNIFAICGGSSDPDELMRGLGSDFEICRNTLKVFACAGWRNPIVEALILLASTHDITARTVEKIHIQAWTGALRFANYADPYTGAQAKFSTEHAAAVALVDRAGGITQFDDARARDPVIAQLRRRVSLEADPQLLPFQVRVFLHVKDGRVLEHFVAAQKGDHLNPFSWDELAAKFRANAMRALPAEQVDQLVPMLRDLEQVDDVAELMRLCRPDAQAR